MNNLVREIRAVRLSRPAPLVMIVIKYLILQIFKNRFQIKELVRQQHLPVSIGVQMERWWKHFNWIHYDVRPAKFFPEPHFLIRIPFVYWHRMYQDDAVFLHDDNWEWYLRLPPYEISYTVIKRFWVDTQGDRYCRDCRNLAYNQVVRTKLFRVRYEKVMRFNRISVVNFVREIKRYCDYCFAMPLFELVNHNTPLYYSPALPQIEVIEEMDVEEDPDVIMLESSSEDEYDFRNDSDEDDIFGSGTDRDDTDED